MIRIEKMGNDNMKEFTHLLSEAQTKNEFIKDFYRFYDDKSFIFRYIVRKMVHLIKYNDIYIGYMWVESPSSETTKLADIYIEEKYVKYFSGKLFLILKTKIVSLDIYENNYTIKLLKTLDMTKIRITYLMKLDNKKRVEYVWEKNLSFSIYKSKKDAKIRCDLQNQIFYDNARVPLSIDDIYYDEKQEYYLKDFTMFLKLNDKEIGYGQIIYSRNMHLIVNFGIIKEYRKRGYGKVLLSKLINLARDKGIQDLYIRVDHNNVAAYNLYASMGFETIGNFSTWMWTND